MATDALLPVLRPDVSDLRAVITTRWSGTSYKPKNIYSIESFYIDTALDNDADSWELVLGDPRGELLELAIRDGEIRTQLFGLGRSNYIMTGIADRASYSGGSWTLTGRDLSSLATDSTLPPQHFRKMRAWSVVDQQARELGFTRRNLAHGRMVQKVFFSDGSESYWDFWYRLYRREQMWIWCDPDGTLRASTLNYSDDIDYYIGDPRDGDSTPVRRACIPVTADGLDISKTTQGRIGKAIVYWHRGDNGFKVTVEDPTTRGWQKRPIKVMLDTDAHTEASAKKTALEEIFESKVGSVEYTLTIPDVGFPIRPNRIARLNIPDIGLSGQFFVVGNRMQGGADGFVQEIRLREKQYAITRRVPKDPEKKTNTPSNLVTSSGMGAAIEGDVTNMPTGWGDYFVKAAKKWHGPWDYQLFLATLIGICHQETGGAFANIRQNGGPGGDHIEWYPYKKPINVVVAGVPVARGGETLEQWRTKFANEAGDGYINWEAGVGPMQLTSRGLKNNADDLLRANFRDEFNGGRWHPEHNIMVAAEYLRSCLKDMVGDSGRAIDMWAGVTAYNMGVGGARAYISAHNYPNPYALKVKGYVYNEPGYLGDVKSSVQTAQTNATTPTGTPPSNFGPLGSMFPYASNIRGLPYGGGDPNSTHSIAFNALHGSNNWQSENAVDIKTTWLTPVYAVHDGQVGNFGVEPDNDRPVYYATPDSMSKLDRFGGNRVNLIGSSQSTYYTHMARLNTKVIYRNARVKRGDLIGWTGIANTLPHLHFACLKGDPRQYTPGVSY